MVSLWWLAPARREREVPPRGHVLQSIRAGAAVSRAARWPPRAGQAGAVDLRLSRAMLILLRWFEELRDQRVDVRGLFEVQEVAGAGDHRGVVGWLLDVVGARG